MNKLILKGNLVKDIEVNVTSNDTLVGEFTVANNEKVGSKDVTTFIKCVMFGERVEKIADYLVKGTKVLVDGRLEVKTIKNDEDIYNTYVSLYVDGLDILKFVDDEEEEEEKPVKSKTKGTGKYTKTKGTRKYTKKK